MIFDPHTLRDWESRGITDVSCFLIERGCAGEKVSVMEGIQSDMDDHSMSQNSITFHTRTSEAIFFSDIRITHTWAKWIVSWDTVNTHCGCGSSFSRKTGNTLHDKITRTKELIRQKKEKAHS